jgi:DNA-binding XRE family transcriptional regulator
MSTPKPDTSTPYSRALKQGRITAGIQQVDLAKTIGIHRALLSDVELGKRRAFHVSRTAALAEQFKAEDPIQLMALAAGERGVDAAMTEGAPLEGLEVLIVLVEKLAKLTPEKAAKLRKYISRL